MHCGDGTPGRPAEAGGTSVITSAAFIKSCEKMICRDAVRGRPKEPPPTAVGEVGRGLALAFAAAVGVTPAPD